MVSEKLIIVLITLAILMSITSIIVTISTINSTKLPEVQNRNIKETVIPDIESGRVSLVIYKSPPLKKP